MDEISDIGAKMNHFALLAALNQELNNCNFSPVGAGISGVFNHTSELHALMYEEAIN